MGNPYWKKLIEVIADADACYGVHTETIGPDELDEEQRFLYSKELLVNLRKDMEEYYEDSTNYWTQRAVDYVRDYYWKDNLSLGQVSEEIGVNPYYLSHIFTEAIG